MKYTKGIEVRRRWGRSELYIDGFPQSTSRYRRDWYKVLKQTKTWRSREPQVLLLGLGGGDIVRVLTKHNSKTRITAIEIMPELVTVAGEYFGVEASQNLTIKIKDANSYMKTNTSQFDLVVVDLYSGDEIPMFVSTKAFLTRLAAGLSPEGQIVVNYASHRFRDLDFDQFESQLSQIFGEVERVVRWGHTFYLANKL